MEDRLSGSFRDNPIVYHLITDRFLHGRSDSPVRTKGKIAEREIGSYHGGDFKGITAKLLDGWFTELGVNALLISAPYEQIHGWVPGGGGEFKHFAYHGYFALDFTTVNKEFGSEADFDELVRTAHRLGIKVLLDVVMNHPGYAV